jgi:peptidyl-prolyl cis-trans isomerase D
MLQSMRDGAHSGLIKFILFGFLVLGVAGLVLMDVGGVFRGGVSSGDVAKIGRERLDLRSFDSEVRRELRRSGLDPQLAYQLGFIEQILMSNVQSRMIRRKAEELGIRMSDREVAARIADLVAPQAQGGTTAQQALDRILIAQGMSEANFVNMLRQEMTSAVLIQALLSGARITPDALARDLYAYNNEERMIDYILFDHESVTDVPEPSQEDLEQYYQATREAYAIPERRDISIAILGPDKLEETLEITDSELEEIYNQNIAFYTLPERRVIEQAIISTQDDAAAVIAQASKEGASLEGAVESVTGSADPYLGAETFSRDGLVQDVAEAAFSATDAGMIDAPVQTALGWHVLRVSEILEPSVTPFAEVKDDLRADYMQTALADELFEQSNIIDDMIAGGASLDEAIAEFPLEIMTMDNALRAGPEDSEDTQSLGENLGENLGDVLETAFQLMEGDTAPVLELDDGRYAFIHVSAVTPKSYRSFEEVEKLLSDSWKGREMNRAAIARAQEAASQADSGTPLDEIASGYGIRTRRAALSRTGENDVFSQQAQAQFFEADKGAPVLAASDKGFILGVVNSVTLPEPDKAPEEEIETLKEELTRSQQGAILSSLIRHLSEKYKLSINRDLLARTYGPQDADNAAGMP